MSGKFVDRVKGRVKNSRGAYEIAKGAGRPKLKRTHMFLPPDLVSFLDDIVYEMKKKQGSHFTVSEVVRVAIRCFQEMPKDQQVKLLLK